MYHVTISNTISNLENSRVMGNGMGHGGMMKTML